MAALYGHRTFDGTAKQLVLGKDRVATVHIKASLANGATIYVGYDNLVSTTSGFSLVAGDELKLRVEDLSTLWAITASTSEVLEWIIDT